MKRNEKVVNLADRKAAMEALKQLYGRAKDGEGKKPGDREPGAEGAREVDKDAKPV